ncbi:MAG TPA: GNAT family N-acetyltransferase [Gemmatimonadales bacterium]|nr:GNAT family N-acetyltransferase [Gemmatimonadales bacterium]
MTDTLVFRLATPSDADALSEFGRRTFREAYVSVMEPALLARVLAEQFVVDRQRAEIADPSARWVVAEAGGRLAGYAYLRAGRVPEVGTAVAPVELARFYVDREWQGRGVARQLMDEAVAQARALGGLTFWLAVWQRNPRAIAFYRKYGFSRIGICSWEHTPGALEDDLMALELAGSSVPA